jgi:amino acid transporter
VLITKTTLYSTFARELPRAGSAYLWIGRTLGVPTGFIASFRWWISVTAAMGFIAFASIPITLALIAAVAVVPHTRWMFQPLLQTAVAAVIAAGLVWHGVLRLRRRGQSLTHVSLNVPLE